MKSIPLAGVITFALVARVLAWSQEGHSTVAEIAQTRLSGPAAQMVRQLLKGRSLASVASWADEERDSHPATTGWHFVNIPLDVERYDPVRDCAKDDCIIAELNRLRYDLRCARGDAQMEALKFAVHFVGDVHQPLHTVLEKIGGNDTPVDVFMRGLATCPICTATHTAANLHAAWDTILIEKTVWNWGAYVDRLENGWLATSSEAKAEDPSTNAALDQDTFRKWAEESHKVARAVWYLRPADDVLDDRYLRDVLPMLDRQLGVAGLRLAGMLNEAYGSNQCSVP
jgi:hypothetical protein